MSKRKIIECPICLGTLDNEENIVIVPCCGNKFHKSCLIDVCKSKSNNANCPLCRNSLATFCEVINPIPNHPVDFEYQVDELIENNQVNVGDTISLETQNQLGNKKWRVQRRGNGQLYATLIHDGYDSVSPMDSEDERLIAAALSRSDDERENAGIILPRRRKKGTKKRRKRKTYRRKKHRQLKKQTAIKSSKKKRRNTYRKK